MSNYPAIRRLITNINRSWNLWQSLRIDSLSASVAYYAIFSIAPLFIIAIAAAGLLVDNTTITTNVIHQFSINFGESSAQLIASLLQYDTSDQSNIIVSIIGAIIIVIGASSTFSQLKVGLDRVFAHQPSKKDMGWWPTLFRKFISVCIVLSVGLLLVASLLITTATTILAHKITAIVPKTELLLQISEVTVSLVLTSIFFAITYKYLPSKKIAWKPALVAGLFSGILFFASKTVLGMILVDSTFSSYGGASALVLLIFWIYIMSQIFFASAFVARIYLLPKINN